MHSQVQTRSRATPARPTSDQNFREAPIQQVPVGLRARESPHRPSLSPTCSPQRAANARRQSLLSSPYTVPFRIPRQQYRLVPCRAQRPSHILSQLVVRHHGLAYLHVEPRVVRNANSEGPIDAHESDESLRALGRPPRLSPVDSPTTTPSKPRKRESHRVLTPSHVRPPLGGAVFCSSGADLDTYDTARFTDTH
jgi:hypothetical protein